MDKVDKARLHYEMERQHVTVAMLCGYLHISRSAFWRKCSGVSEFTRAEIQRIVEYLDLKTPVGIFFADEVS